MRELTYYVAASLDGYIAAPDGRYDDFEVSPELIDFISTNYPETLPTPARTHLGIDAPNTRFDTVLMGRATYEVGLPQGLISPYRHLEQIVFSRTLKPVEKDEAVQIERGDPVDVVRALKGSDGRGIWLCGGGRLAGALAGQIDELVVKRQPIILGSGRPMFAGPFAVHRFQLAGRAAVGAVSVETYRRRLPA
jgi:dihydrofolate reductase